MPIKKKATKVFAAVTDIAALVMSVIYVTFVSLMLGFELGQLWLNAAMLGMTALYICFFLFKIFYINNVAPDNKFSKQTKKIYKYTKYGMKLVNAVFVVLSIIAVRTGVEHIIPMIGVITLVMTFVISILWDVGLFFAKRKIKDILLKWKALDKTQKKDKIDFVIEQLLESLDNVDLSDFGEYVEHGVKASEIISTKISKVRKKDEQILLDQITE